MRLGQQLSILQTQKLIMTPELRQAINILQLNTLELSQFIQEQLLENPLLEVMEEVQTNQDTQEEKATKESEIDWQEYFSDKSDLGYQFEPKEEISFENFLTKSITLHEYLEDQIRGYSLSEEEVALAQFVIGNIDERGYCTLASTINIAKDLGVKEEKLEEMVNLIQTLEPHGIGARNLQECLLIQLKKQGKLTPLFQEVIMKYLAILGQGRYNKVATELNISIQELQSMMDFLKTLNPKPGSAFGSAHDVRFIIPDIIVERIDHEYIVLVNDTSAPRLTINQLYREILNKDHADQITKNFVEKKFHGALWLIKSIEQRRITLYRVANTLVRLQKDFLDKDQNHLAPLSLKDVAVEIDVHESTVSRAIANKFIQTPKGLYPLKYFFSTALETKSGEKVSSQSIKKIIEDLVSKECSQNPYSDHQVSTILAEQGIKIARRTIAKYRDELGILAVAQRKRY